MSSEKKSERLLDKFSPAMQQQLRDEIAAEQDPEKETETPKPVDPAVIAHAKKLNDSVKQDLSTSKK